jgi:signal transduction histidine kinase/CheY-like chemotaxis protein
VSKPRAVLDAFLGWFIPAALRDRSEDEYRRARVAISVAWLMVVVFTVLTITRWAGDNPIGALGNLALLTAIAAGPFILKYTGRLVLVVNLELACTFVAMISIAVTARGAGLTAEAVALAEIPLFAMLLAGVRSGIAWAILSCIATLVLGVLGHVGVIAERVPRSSVLFLDHSALVVIVATLFLIGLLYERAKDLTLRRMEALERQKRATELARVKAEADAKIATAERLASMGRLAASVAHEINNPLSYVAYNLSFLKDSLPPGTELEESVRDGLDGVERIRRIVRDMQSFTRPDDEETSGVDVARAITTAIKMAEGHTKPRARVTVEIGDVPRVLADETRLVQVILNLVVNAAQAIEEGRADENEIAIRASVSNGHVEIEVRDTGRGIAPEHMDRVREPFFSTKPIGEGIGLGLALCETTVTRYGGSLEIDSKPGSTVVRVRLPAAPDRPGAVPSERPPAPAKEAALRILVIDDDVLVGRALKRMLGNHEVTVKQSGRDALDLLLGGARFDAIFCDVMMPDCSGMDVYETLAAERPEPVERVVFMTGGTFTERAAEFRTSVGNTFVDKPVNAVTLRTVLDGVTRRIGERVSQRPGIAKSR